MDQVIEGGSRYRFNVWAWHVRRFGASFNFRASAFKVVLHAAHLFQIFQSPHILWRGFLCPLAILLEVTLVCGDEHGQSGEGFVAFDCGPLLVQDLQPIGCDLRFVFQLLQLALDPLSFLAGSAFDRPLVLLFSNLILTVNAVDLGFGF
jgi:hypothetical protein